MADDPKLDLDEIEETAEAEREFDLDEDLFGFDAVMPSEDLSEDDIDLDEIFAAFQDVEADAQELSEEEKEADESSDAPEATGAPAIAESPEAEASAEAPATAKEPASDALPIPEPGDAKTNPLSLPQAPTVVQAGMGRAFLVGLLAMVALNLAIAFYTFKSAGSMREELARTGRQMSDTATRIQDGVENQTKTVQETYLPIVPPDPRNHPGLAAALADIEAGRFADARQRLYALIAVIDRMDPEEREEIEARATYLLARSVHAEALERRAAEEGAQ